MGVSSTKILIGTAGWSYEDWKGIVYPNPMPKGMHALELLCAWFDVVEINASFYRPCDPRHAASWLRKVEANPDFMFTAKLWERFTHRRDSWPETADVDRYLEGIQPLHQAGKLGAILVQFPWSFRRTPENRQWLGRIAETFAGYPLAVELRHETWNVPDFYAGLRKSGIAFCNIDQPIFDDSIKPSSVSTARIGYVRLHGRNYDNWFREGAGRNARYDYLYTEEELNEWAGHIQAVADEPDTNAVYVTTNNHYTGKAVANALELSRMLGVKKPRIPEELLAAYPRLRS